MTTTQLAVVLFFAAGAAAIIWSSWSWYHHNLEREQWKRLVTQVAQHNDEVRHALALGLYERFRPARPGETKEEDPHDFEKFVARVMGWQLGGEGTVTRGLDDLSVDVVISVDGVPHLGLVKCEGGPVGYESVAIIHSQVLGEGARDGFVVSFNGFTASARQYARAVGVRLITGPELINTWLEALDAEAATAKQLLGPEEAPQPEPAVTD